MLLILKSADDTVFNISSLSGYIYISFSTPTF